MMLQAPRFGISTGTTSDQRTASTNSSINTAINGEQQRQRRYSQQQFLTEMSSVPSINSSTCPAQHRIMRSVIGTLMTALDNLLFDERLIPTSLSGSGSFSGSSAFGRSGNNTSDGSFFASPRRTSAVQFPFKIRPFDCSTPTKRSIDNVQTTVNAVAVKYQRLAGDEANSQFYTTENTTNPSQQDIFLQDSPMELNTGSSSGSFGRKVLKLPSRQRNGNHQNQQQSNSTRKCSEDPLLFLLSHHSQNRTEALQLPHSPETLQFILNDINETVLKPPSSYHQSPLSASVGGVSKDLDFYRTILEEKKRLWGPVIFEKHDYRQCTDLSDNIHTRNSVRRARLWILELGCLAVEQISREIDFKVGWQNIHQGKDVEMFIRTIVDSDLGKGIETALILFRECLFCTGIFWLLPDPSFQFEDFFDLSALSNSISINPLFHQRLFRVLIVYLQFSENQYDAGVQKSSKARVIQYFENIRKILQGAAFSTLILSYAQQHIRSELFISADFLEDFGCALIENGLRFLEHIASQLLHNSRIAIVKSPASICVFHQDSFGSQKSDAFIFSSISTSQSHLNACPDLINIPPSILFWLAFGVKFIKQSIETAGMICRLRFTAEAKPSTTISLPQDVIDEELRITRIYHSFKSVIDDSDNLH